MIAGILMAVLSITVTLLLVSGVNRKTITAILGTVSGVVIAGIIAYLFGELSNLSGITMSDSRA